MEAVKLEMYSDQVFFYTQGDGEAPRGATPLDFAMPSTPSWGTCVGASGWRRVPLDAPEKRPVGGCHDRGRPFAVVWLEIAVTGKARTAIRRSLQEVDRERFIKLGQELARSAFVCVGRKAADKALDTAAAHLRLADRDTLLARLGSAELTAHDVVQAVYPELADGDKIPVGTPLSVVVGPVVEHRTASRCRVNGSWALRNVAKV